MPGVVVVVPGDKPLLLLLLLLLFSLLLTVSLWVKFCEIQLWLLHFPFVSFAWLVADEQSLGEGHRLAFLSIGEQGQVRSKQHLAIRFQ